MAARNVLKLGNPLLRQTSVALTEEEVATKDFKKLVKDMFDTMKLENGVGLAAPQIGVLKRLVVIGAEKSERYPNTDDLQEEVLINPVLTPLAPPKEGFWEGCLSVPGMRGLVERPFRIKMEWYDMKWNRHVGEFEGFRAIVYQHECDHLDGVLYVDRLKDPRQFGFTDELENSGTSKGKELD
jgi:peptide deformylase